MSPSATPGAASHGTSTWKRQHAEPCPQSRDPETARWWTFRAPVPDGETRGEPVGAREAPSSCVCRPLETGVLLPPCGLVGAVFRPGPPSTGRRTERTGPCALVRSGAQGLGFPAGTRASRWPFLRKRARGAAPCCADAVACGPHRASAARARRGTSLSPRSRTLVVPPSKGRNLGLQAGARTMATTGINEGLRQELRRRDDVESRRRGVARRRRWGEGAVPLLVSPGKTLRPKAATRRRERGGHQPCRLSTLSYWRACDSCLLEKPV